MEDLWVKDVDYVRHWHSIVCMVNTAVFSVLLVAALQALSN